MRTLNKNGVHIDQCEGCRGVFLDRGELEQIMGAESAYYANQAPPPYQPGPGHHPGQVHGHGDSPRPYGGGRGDSPRPFGGGFGHGHGDSPRPYGHSGHKKRRGSFLENLFD